MTDILNPFYKVKNDYNNNTLRYSFSIEVIKCKDNLSLNQTCQPNWKIDRLFNHIYFTMFNIQSRINYSKAKEQSNAENAPDESDGHEVVTVTDTFHS